MEAVIALAVLLRRFDFALVPNQDIAMTTGATIHTSPAGAHLEPTVS